MTGFIYEGDAFGVFVLVTLILGGGAAWLTGRAAAQTWRPVWQVLVYCFMLGAAVRFIHFSLFGGTLLSLYYYAVDTAVCILFALAGFRAARAGQMVRQYGWINKSLGPFRWRRKTP
jgi:uncharacterized protein DUF6867